MFGVWFEGSFVQESKKDTHTLLLSLSSVWWKRHYQQRRRFGLFTAHSENKILTRFSTDWRRYSARTWLTWETLMRNINWPRANLLKVFSPKCIHTTPCHPYSRLCHWSTSCGQQHQCRRQIHPPAPSIKVKIKITKKHCQRHNGPEGWVHLAKVISQVQTQILIEFHLQNLD